MSKKDLLVNEEVDNFKKLKEEFSRVLDTLSGLKSKINELNVMVKTLEKNVNKKIRVMDKESNKNKNKGNRKPTGFASQGPISKELCNFLNVEKGTEFARTEVTRYIIKYIKDKNLQDKDNKRVIKPDAALKSLLKTKKTDELTYFNLQKHMNKHFVKKKGQ
jgi:chromatin remodeling complex protein RSC6